MAGSRLRRARDQDTLYRQLSHEGGKAEGCGRALEVKVLSERRKDLVKYRLCAAVSDTFPLGLLVDHVKFTFKAAKQVPHSNLHSTPFEAQRPDWWHGRWLRNQHCCLSRSGRAVLWRPPWRTGLP